VGRGAVGEVAGAQTPVVLEQARLLLKDALREHDRVRGVGAGGPAVQRLQAHAAIERRRRALGLRIKACTRGRAQMTTAPSLPP
jgi:hypothetical protein